MPWPPGGRASSARHIRQALDQERLEAGSVLTASIARDHRAIRSGAVQHGLAPDLLWLVAELAVSPFVFALQRSILVSSPVDADLASALAGWQHGYCPACGSWPALAEVAVDRTVLRCSFCSLGWERRSSACIYCDDHEDHVVLREPAADHPHQRIQSCSTCSGYLKILEVATLSPFPFVGIGDLETMELDMSAMREGLGRPQVREFAPKR